MKLTRLQLENFRQFKGIQEIEFAHDRYKNVTLLWGANGSGKTTLLNAFTWVLYGQFTKDFEKPESLANQDVWASLAPGDRVEVSVEVEFEHSDQIFTATRRSAYRKGEDGSQVTEQSGVPSLTFIDATGRSHKSGDPDDHIRQILPERLHSFFFFNGERIEHLVHASAYEEIEDAIKTILGLKVVERAIKHLPTAAKRFEQELRAHGTAEQRDIAQRLQDLDIELEDAQAKRADSERAATNWQDEIDAVSAKLLGTEEARSKQRERQALEETEQEQIQAVAKTTESIQRLIRERGYLAFGHRLFEQTREQFRDKREKKELPAPVKRDFIEDLLAEAICICGASLAAGTEGYQHIMDWKQRAGLAEVEQRWTELHAYADSYASERSDMEAELNRLIDDRNTMMERRQLTSERISGVSANLQGITKDNIDELESLRVTAQRNKDDEVRKQGKLDHMIAGLRMQKSQLELELRRVASVEAKAELAQRRLTVTRDAQNTLDTIYTIRTEQTRADLDSKIKEVYGNISFKPYIPEVRSTFQLDLVHSSSGEPVAKSTGENQILSLSFVGALASIARARYEETKDLSSASGEVRGGIFPIVMDAAFGSLDLNYRKEVALGLPDLAEQVVVIVSKSGGEGTYEHFRDRVGKSYIIQYTTPKIDAADETIEIDGVEYEYVQSSSDGSEFASIGEVE